MITTITLNASIDKAYYMPGVIEYGKVMRVGKCINSAGGKGLNVARTVKLLGENVLATGFAGGHTGDYLLSLLEKDGIPAGFIHVEAETRNCINIIDSRYGSTEFLERGEKIGSGELGIFLEKLPQIIKDSSVVTISGSAPQGVPDDIYADIISIIRAEGKKAVLDSSGVLLKKGVEALPDLIKPNRDELEALTGTSALSAQGLIDACSGIQKKGIKFVVISLGAEGALIVSDEGVFKGTVPVMEAVNTVGCGDAMTGALAVSLAEGLSTGEMLRRALACGSAKAMSAETGSFDTAVMNEIYGLIKIEKLR